MDVRGIFAHKMLNFEKYSLIFSQITLCKSERRRIIEERKQRGAVTMTYLKRKIDEMLRQWKADPKRKPLIVKGPRQIGKTESVHHFAEANYTSVIYINFVEEPKYKLITEDGYKTDDIIKNISRMDPAKRFIPGETLIFFDELQEFPDIATALKFFHIDGRFDVICSGSMLGINYRKIESNSVGYKSDYEMKSLDFEEFLWAKGYEADFVEDIYQHMVQMKPFNEVLLKTCHNLFLDYCILGGMPAVVKEYIEKGTFEGTQEIQKQLILDYKEDIRKYADGVDQTRILNIFNQIPVQLAKENKKFIYSAIRSGARAKDFEVAIQWLVDCGLILKNYNTETPQLPLSAHENFDIFKLYLLDIGLLGALSNLDAKTIIEGNSLFVQTKGAFAEQYAMQELSIDDNPCAYWTNPTGNAEVDFVKQISSGIFPVEVKSADNVKAKSLNIYREKYSPKLAIRASLKNYGLENNILSLPLYALGSLSKYCADRISGKL